MIKKISSTFILLMLSITMMPLFTPTIFAQEATNTIKITDCDTGCMLTVTITSPVSVSEYQLSIKVSSNIIVDTSQATLTGFMAGSAVLSQDGVNTDEYRWFNLQSQGGATGTLSVPISNLETGNKVSIDKADILDVNGNRITTETSSFIYSFTATVITTSTTTTTVRSTITSTSTATRTTTSTSTATRTTTSTADISTSTVTTTSTAISTQTITTTAVPSTISSTITTTNTSTVEEQVDSTSTISLAVAALAIVLLGITIVLKIRKPETPT